MGAKMMVYGGFAIAFGAYAAVNQVDKSLNYQSVSAQIVSISVDCSVEAGRNRLVEKGTRTKAYMDCDVATYAAEQHGYDESDIKRRAKVTYEYKSPVDDNWYTNQTTIDDADENLDEGDAITILAHKETPSKSRYR